MAAVELEVHGDVAEIVLNRPDKKNALRDEDWLLLRDVVGQAERSPARCVLFRGAGDSFCAGWDLSQADAAQVDARKTVGEIVNPALVAIRNLRLPTIAAASGACVGGGLGIAMACDIVLAAEDARFGSPFRNIGILLDSGGHHFLRERLGHYKASQLIYTGKLIDGREAHRIGLVCEVYPAARLLDEARAMAAGIAGGPTAAFVLSKKIMMSGADYKETLALEADGQAEIFATQDAAEGLRAFREKRKPTFIGR